MTKLVIVESPAKCKKIESYLGAGYKCIASFGHFRGIRGGLKDIDFTNNYMPKFSVMPGKTKYVTNMRNCIRNSTSVILATDDDREGEAIAWHICDEFNLPLETTSRIIFHEITKPAILRAIKNPTTVNMSQVNAQFSRQVLDLLIGFTVSPILWKHISRNNNSKLSAGRCQTPALQIIYDNQKEIEEAPGKKVYKTSGNFTDNNIPFDLNFEFTKEDSVRKFLEKSKTFQHVISFRTEKEKTKKQPIPMTTSNLQQKASNELGFSPKRTMQVAQKLYEKGYITYMRTDSKKYSAEFIDKAKKYIKDKWGEEYWLDDKGYGEITVGVESETKKKKKVVKKKAEKGGKGSKGGKGGKDDLPKAQEAHEAIRPTNPAIYELPPQEEDSSERRLYKFIYSVTVESCMAPATCLSLPTIISCPSVSKDSTDKSKKGISYKNNCEKITFPGWKIVRGYDKEAVVYTYLTALRDKYLKDKTKPRDKIANYSQIQSNVSIKNLKSHYTEAKLVQELEKKGIGRPSTFSSIVSKNQEREYVKIQNVEGQTIECVDFKLSEVKKGEDEAEKSMEIVETKKERTFGNEKNKIVLQQKGMAVMEFLIKHFSPIFNYEYTKQMENTLDEISKGDIIWHDPCAKCHSEIKEQQTKLGGKEKLSIKIDEHHKYIIGKYGPVIICNKDGKTSFKNVKREISLEKLKKGEYTLEEIVYVKPKVQPNDGYDSDTSSVASDTPVKKVNRVLGDMKGKPVVLRSGKYGPYLNWNGKNKTVKYLKKELDDIDLKDAVKLFTYKSKYKK